MSKMLVQGVRAPGRVSRNNVSDFAWHLRLLPWRLVASDMPAAVAGLAGLAGLALLAVLAVCR